MPGQPIPVPPDFPVEWRTPSDPDNFWMRDIVHFPYPNAPLAASFLETILEPGMNHGAAKLEMPVRFQWRMFNTYCYSTTTPVFGVDGKPL